MHCAQYMQNFGAGTQHYWTLGLNRMLLLIGFTDQASHRSEHFFVIKRFGDIVGGSLTHGLNSRAQTGIAGHNQHWHRASRLNKLGAGAARQAQIADNQIKLIEVVGLLGGFYADSFRHSIIMALQQLAQR